MPFYEKEIDDTTRCMFGILLCNIDDFKIYLMGMAWLVGACNHVKDFMPAPSHIKEGVQATIIICLM